LIDFVRKIEALSFGDLKSVRGNEVDELVLVLVGNDLFAFETAFDAVVVNESEIAAVQNTGIQKLILGPAIVDAL